MNYIELILQSHLFLFVFLILLFIVEYSFGIMIFIFWFKHKKSPIAARGTASREALLYFIYNILYAAIKLSIDKQYSEDFNLFIWIIVIFILSLFLRRLYLKYQGVDKNHPDYFKYFPKKIK